MLEESLKKSKVKDKVIGKWQMKEEWVVLPDDAAVVSSSSDISGITSQNLRYTELRPDHLTLCDAGI
jgi:hypothetical protein